MLQLPQRVSEHRAPSSDGGEFRDDVVRVARSRSDGVTFAQVADDFGIYTMMLSGWMKKAGVEDGAPLEVCGDESIDEFRGRTMIVTSTIQANEIDSVDVRISQFRIPLRTAHLIREATGLTPNRPHKIDARELLVGPAGWQCA